MPDPRMSANEITARFAKLDDDTRVLRNGMLSMKKETEVLLGEAKQRIEVLDMRVEELEKELYGE